MRTTRALRPLAAACAVSLLLAACGTDDGSSADDPAGPTAGSGADGADAFPVTIEHAYGETVGSRSAPNGSPRSPG
ncbi:MAG: hypothetical protein ACO1ON_08490 [Nocardioides sp.]